MLYMLSIIFYLLTTLSEFQIITSKALYLNIEDGFDDKSGENYWKVSVNEFLSYVNQRSKIIIEQLTGESHSVNIELDDNSNKEE